MTESEFTPETLADFLEKEGFHSEERGEPRKLFTFIRLLNAWNGRTNLVGPRTCRDIARTLILDSLHLARFLRSLPLPEAPETWDLGAGAGIPGIPLRLIWTPGTYRLVEVREKRTLFLRTALAHIKPARTSVVAGRAEDFMKAQAHAGKAGDIVLSRAFMPWPELLSFAAPYLAHDGRIIILANIPAPVAELPDGWTLEAMRRYTAADKNRYFWSLRHTGQNS